MEVEHLLEIHKLHAKWHEEWADLRTVVEHFLLDNESFFEANGINVSKKGKFALLNYRQLWRHLRVDDMMHRGAHKLYVSYMDGELSLKSHTYQDSRHPNCHRDVCPSWVKAHMLLGTSCEYEDEVAHVKVTDGKFQLLRGPKECQRDSLFGGCNAVPSYSFDVDIRSDTWVGLLEKWSDLSFKWLHMCEDSRCMP